MLTEKEFIQIRTAIKSMNCPMSRGEEQTCWKSDVVNLLTTYVEGEKDGR